MIQLNGDHEKQKKSTNNFKFQTEIVNGVCGACNLNTLLVGIDNKFYRCISCGEDLEQKVNGVISYIPHLTKQSLQSEVEKYFDGEA